MSTSENLRQEIREFEMPRAATGSPVLWYRTGRKNCDPVVGYMLHCGKRTCQLFLTSGRRQEAVRHVSDPKLNLSVDQRESGAWDFTDEAKQYAEFRKNLDERLTNIEKQIKELQAGKPIQKPKTKKDPKADEARSKALKEYHELKRRAKGLGLQIGNVKKAELEKVVMNAEAENSHSNYPREAI